MISVVCVCVFRIKPYNSFSLYPFGFMILQHNLVHQTNTPNSANSSNATAVKSISENDQMRPVLPSKRICRMHFVLAMFMRSHARCTFFRSLSLSLLFLIRCCCSCCLHLSWKQKSTRGQSR